MDSIIQDLKTVGAMVLVQVSLSGVNIFYKLALNEGMSVQVLVAYRYIFAFASLGPVAFFIERKTRPGLTWTVLMLNILCAFFGGAFVQNLFIEGLKMTSITFATAISNLIPVMTFLLAIAFRLEKFSVRKLPEIAKVMGTMVGLGGAMVLTFYRGSELKLWSTNVNLIHGSRAAAAAVTSSGSTNNLVGSLLCIIGCFSYAIWFIIQAKMNQIYPCPYSSTALICAFASVMSVVYALCVEKNNWSAWDLGFDIKLLAVSYCGVFATGPMVAIMSWCIRKKGPLFVSVFNPLSLLVVAILGSLFLNDKLYVGTVIGAVLVVVGLYMVIWGKGKEVTEKMGVDGPSSVGQSSRRASFNINSPSHAVVMEATVVERMSKEEEDRRRNGPTANV